MVVAATTVIVKPVVEATKIPQCSTLFATPSWCYGFGRAQEGIMLRIRRRGFITLLGGAAAWPLAAGAQQPARIRRIGVLMSQTPDDPDSQPRLSAFLQALQELRWIGGSNVQIEYRWGAGESEHSREAAAELIAFDPDVILASGGAAAAALHRATRTVPVVFVSAIDPVGSGLVESLARPSGHATGFTAFESGFSGKWLELLKEIAPPVRRVAVMRTLSVNGGAQFGAIQGGGAAARSRGNSDRDDKCRRIRAWCCCFCAPSRRWLHRDREWICAGSS
jgi:putative ABC transport system substrate-binding protein